MNIFFLNNNLRIHQTTHHPFPTTPWFIFPIFLNTKEKENTTLKNMENVTDCYTKTAISPLGSLVSIVEMPFQKLPRAFRGPQEVIIYFWRNRPGVGRAGSLSSPSSVHRLWLNYHGDLAPFPPYFRLFPKLIDSSWSPEKPSRKQAGWPTHLSSRRSSR